MEKKDLRAFIRAKKRAMTSAQVEAASARLAEKLFQHPAYQPRRACTVIYPTTRRCARRPFCGRRSGTASV